jgi:hypothetical protein
MSTFQLVGLPADTFSALFDLDDDTLRARGIVRRVADAQPGFPCRIGLVDAEPGEELLLLPFEHHPAGSPYRASGPIFVRRGSRQQTLPAGEVPAYVSSRVISLRGYDAAGMMIEADVRPGTEVAACLEQMFANVDVAYVHLHNAKRGCFSCLARRA